MKKNVLGEIAEGLQVKIAKFRGEKNSYLESLHTSICIRVNNLHV